MGTVDLTRTEILAQDDASPDYDATQLFQYSPAKVERNAENLGFAGNCNAGAARAKGDYLMFVNQDVRATAPGWADAMLNMAVDTMAGIVGPKLVFPDGSIQSAGGWFDANKGPFHRYLSWTNASHRLVNTPEPVAWVTGAALMIRRDDFEALGGFDTGYERGYFEDVDLCMRVRVELGKEIWYCPGAVMQHEVASTGGIPPHIFRANSTRFHQKWDAHIEPDVNTIMVDY